MREELLDTLDAAFGGADVAALTAKVAAFARKAIIRSESNNAAAEDVRVLVDARFQHRPSDGAMAYVEGKVEFAGGRRKFFYCMGRLECVVFHTESRQS